MVATAWAGIPAYFSNYRMIDILGYNDRTVAHMQPVVPLDEDHFDTFRPGHAKWDEQRLLGEQRPDAFFQIWGVRPGPGGGGAAELRLPQVGGSGCARIRRTSVPAPAPPPAEGDPDPAPRRAARAGPPHPRRSGPRAPRDATPKP